jgi:dihydrofolate reductase
VYYVATSLDGYIAPLNGSVDWLSPFEQSGDDFGYRDFLANIQGIILGRRTYEQVLTFGPWPYVGMPAWVCTRTANRTGNGHVTMTTADPESLLAEIDALGIQRVWMLGGGELAGVFHDLGRIDEYRISVMPILLGRGLPLLGSATRQRNLTLVRSQSYSAGVVQLTYHPQS